MAPTTPTPPAAPPARMDYEALVNDPTEWDMPAIAVALGVQHQTVKIWRKDSLAAARAAPKGATPHPNHLPPPARTQFGKPIWTAGVIRRWAMQTGRMTPEGVAMRGKPPGRPRTKAAA